MLKFLTPIFCAILSISSFAQSSPTYQFRKPISSLAVEYTPIGGELSLSTGALNFGAVNLNQVTTLSLVVTNTSAQKVPVAVSSSGPFSSQTTCPAKLDASQTCTVEVTMQTTSAGNKTGQLLISNSAQNSIVSLSGSVVTYSLTASSTDLQLGDKTYGALVTAELQFTNNGTGNLANFYVPIPSGWSATSANNCPTAAATLNAGSSCTFQIRRLAESGLKVTNVLAYSSSLASPVSSNITYTGSASDPYANQVVFKLTGETGNVADESPSAVSLLSNSNKPTISTADKAFGTKSYYFAPGFDYIRTGEIAEFAFGAGEFTVEGWFNIQSWNNSGFLALIDFRYYYWNDARPALYYTNGNIAWVNGSGQTISTGAFPLNTWTHVAYTRKNNVGYLFINGQLRSSGSDPKTYSTNTGVTIGQAGDASSGALTCTFCDVKGYVDNVRITKGTARYTTNFIPTDF